MSYSTLNKQTLDRYKSLANGQKNQNQSIQANLGFSERFFFICSLIIYLISFTCDLFHTSFIVNNFDTTELLHKEQNDILGNSKLSDYFNCTWNKPGHSQAKMNLCQKGKTVGGLGEGHCLNTELVHVYMADIIKAVLILTTYRNALKFYEINIFYLFSIF